jgi:hypothetical protein
LNSIVIAGHFRSRRAVVEAQRAVLEVDALSTVPSALWPMAGAGAAGACGAAGALQRAAAGADGAAPDAGFGALRRAAVPGVPTEASHGCLQVALRVDQEVRSHDDLLAVTSRP